MSYKGSWYMHSFVLQFILIVQCQFISGNLNKLLDGILDAEVSPITTNKEKLFPGLINDVHQSKTTLIKLLNTTSPSNKLLNKNVLLNHDIIKVEVTNQTGGFEKVDRSSSTVRHKKLNIKSTNGKLDDHFVNIFKTNKKHKTRKLSISPRYKSKTTLIKTVINNDDKKNKNKEKVKIIDDKDQFKNDDDWDDDDDFSEDLEDDDFSHDFSLQEKPKNTKNRIFKRKKKIKFNKKGKKRFGGKKGNKSDNQDKDNVWSNNKKMNDDFKISDMLFKDFNFDTFKKNTNFKANKVDKNVSSKVTKIKDNDDDISEFERMIRNMSFNMD